tara:strand:+ start:932 stop:1297 length:366 start_codon:yes stop_codon:yes gene_type:complete
MSNYIEERPWGSFEILLDEKTCKVKKIIVKPGHRLSYQYHKNRNECWVIVEGEATITHDDFLLVANNPEIINIPAGAKHRVENKGKEDLVFIETQTGTYFGEDDIVRIEDDYGRDKNEHKD